MTRRLILATLIFALGAIITIFTLRDGVAFSFPLLLGVLLLADSALRVYVLTQDARGSSEHEPGRPSRH